MNTTHDYAKSLQDRVGIILILCTFGLLIQVFGVLRTASQYLWVSIFCFIIYSSMASLFFRNHSENLLVKIDRHLWAFQFLDILFLTIIIHYLGTDDTLILIVLYYTLVINTFTSKFFKTLTFLKANGSMFLFATIMILENYGILAHHQVGRWLLTNPEKISLVTFGTLSLNACALFKVQNEERLRAQSKEIILANLTLEEKVSSQTEELKKANQSIKNQFSELKSAYQQLVRSEKLASLGTMVAGLCHEVFNPLNCIAISNEAIHKHCEYLLEVGNSAKNEVSKRKWDVISIRRNGRNWNDTSDRLRFLFEQMKLSIIRIERLVSNSKNIGRVDTDEISQINLDQMLKEALVFLTPIIHEKNANINWDIKENCQIKGMPGPLNQAFANILKNSLDAINPNGNISIHAHRENGHVEIQIRDDGSGIMEEHLNRIFDPFFTTKGPDEGTGLGLSICHRIIVSHQGNIKVDSKQGIGTTIFVQLPVHSNNFSRFVE